VKRPLTTTELCCALAVERNEVELDPENIPDVEDLLSVCAGLVVVDQESAVIRLVHYTTQEYFERVIDTWNPDAPLQIALTCLTYLSYDVFRTGSCSSDEDFEERLQENKFLHYAAKHWSEHAATVETRVCAIVCSFLLDDCLVSSATQVLLAPTYKYHDYSQDYPKDNTGAHLAARLGLTVSLETLLLHKGQERKAEFTKKDSEGQTLLYLAARNGHYLTAKLLIDEGAEVNAQGGRYYSTALQAASYSGHGAVVKLLIEQGAEVNAQGGTYGNALQAASREGHEAVVKLLIKQGAEVNAQGGLYGTALQAASAEGHEAVVKLLIEQGAEVNAQGGYFGNALQAASGEGNEAVVNLLIEQGAKVNAQGGGFGNALQAASYSGHEAVVRLLIEHGAEQLPTLHS
jgi:ankyrin repeat protein